MDVDWCFCGRRAEGKSPYCSDECFGRDMQAPCLDYDTSSLSDLDDEFEPKRSLPPRVFPSKWAGTDRIGILAWASEIPACKPESPRDSTPKLRAPSFPLTRQRPVPPALSMSTTQPARTKSSPISTPQATAAHVRSRISDPDGSYNSLVSALTDSVATPASIEKNGVLGGLASRLRSWGNTTTAASQKQHHDNGEKPAAQPFAVLSTAHPLHSDVLYPAAPGGKWAGKDSLYGEGHTATVWISKSKDEGFRERAPVSLRVDREADHFSHLSRGRKISRAVNRGHS